MIDELRASNVALIREAAIEPADGLTVLTGETGAGKTALLGALKLLVGERGDAGLVREGADALVVEGRVVSTEDPEGHIVRRRVAADGRGRVELDGHMASVRELAEGVGSTVDLCGQHEHQRLLTPATHVELLDAWIGSVAAQARQAYIEALKEAQDAHAELERIRDARRADNTRVDQARFVLARIEEVHPQEGELEELEETLPRAEHAEALMLAAQTAREALFGDEGASDKLSDAIAALEDAARYDEKLATFAETLQSALLDIEDIAAALRDYQDTVEFDPQTLDRMQNRMAQLQGLMRTYGPRMVDVLVKQQEARELVDAADNNGELEEAAERACEEAEVHLKAAAQHLDEVRQKAAPRLAQKVCDQMRRLEMGTAEISIDIESLPRDQWGPAGASKVEMLYRPAESMSARPLRKIASGGEVSRVMLACKVALGNADGVDTLVFDEVDAGVGGATARALALVLADLAKTHQVIVVTHLAQVAVMGTRHYLVRKHTDAQGIPETEIVELAGEDRVKEIARMLSGEISSSSQDLARQMLEQAQQSDE